MKAGIITFHRAHNLGAVLQAYALQKYMNDNVCLTEIIDYYPNNMIAPPKSMLHSLGHWVKSNVSQCLHKNNVNRYKKFNEFTKLYKLSEKTYFGDADIAANPPEYDIVISGSDQIFNTTITGNSKAYYLEFVNKGYKISYASSFGRTEITNTEKAYIKEYLKDFFALSVREHSAGDIINSEIGIRPNDVLDPVFLLSKEEWETLENDRIDAKSEYIFVYSMENSLILEGVIESLKKETGLRAVIVCGSGKVKKSLGKIDYECGPRDFLKYIRNAKYVITNSFHGIAFSIIYKKQFIAISHSTRNVRIENILETAGFIDKLVSWYTDYSIVIDYLIEGIKAYKSVEPYIIASQKYLSESILGGGLQKKTYFPKSIQTISSIVRSKRCSFCSACISVCPVSAIEIKKDDNYCDYPIINKQKCISCGACARVCHIINQPTKFQPNRGIALRIKNGEDLYASTSGGAFTAISDYILSKNGIVFGAVFDESWNCIHTSAENTQTRNLMRGAKYIQSNIKGIHTQVIEALRKNKTVLFTGTPCQVASVRNMVDKECIDESKLILIDIVCHGVASERYLQDHISRLTKKKGKVASYRFRSKDVGWHGYNVRVDFSDGTYYLNNKYSNEYAELYFSSLIMRTSCLTCPYTTLKRVGDITMADFWGIEKLDKSFDDNYGVSCVLINSLKGELLLSNIQDKILYKEFPLDCCIQPNMKSPVCLSIEADKFKRDYKLYGFAFCAKKYSKSSKIVSFRRNLSRGIRKIKKIFISYL